jgi:hypothetical protein
MPFLDVILGDRTLIQKHLADVTSNLVPQQKQDEALARALELLCQNLKRFEDGYAQIRSDIEVAVRDRASGSVFGSAVEDLEICRRIGDALDRRGWQPPTAADALEQLYSNARKALIPQQQVKLLGPEWTFDSTATGEFGEQLSLFRGQVCHEAENLKNKLRNNSVTEEDRRRARNWASKAWLAIEVLALTIGVAVDVPQLWRDIAAAQRIVVQVIAAHHLDVIDVIEQFVTWPDGGHPYLEFPRPPEPPRPPVPSPPGPRGAGGPSEPGAMAGPPSRRRTTEPDPTSRHREYPEPDSSPPNEQPPADTAASDPDAPRHTGQPGFTPPSQQPPTDTAASDPDAPRHTGQPGFTPPTHVKEPPDTINEPAETEPPGDFGISPPR